MSAQFIHLRVHSELSLTDSVVRVPALISQAVSEQMPAVALTDESNVFALVKFYQYALKQGVKPIIGADVWVTADDSNESPMRLTLLCQTHDGYQNMSRLVTKAYADNHHQKLPFIKRSWLTSDALTGLIALSGGRKGDIAQALLTNREEEARERLAYWLSVFPERFYIELQRLGWPDESHIESSLLALATEFDVPVVATNPVRFLQPDEFQTHEARVSIQESELLIDENRPKRYQPSQYFKSQTEMCELFADIPSALQNTVEIAKRCSVEFDASGDVLHLPDIEVPEPLTQNEYLRQRAEQGLAKRLEKLGANNALSATHEEYYARLNSELGVIEQMNYPGYFLIVADFVQWSKDNDVPVGPGRGSGAGSLVAYALKIIDIDPLAYDLLFERFLNPERVSMPDFDIDFCMNKRELAIKYVAQKYGHDHVGQIITYGRMAAKAVVRDAGRVLGYPYGFVDHIAKLIPFGPKVTLDSALADEDELQEAYETDEEIREVLDLAKSLEGLARNAGTHAGGVVIAPKPLTDYMPLYSESSESDLITQFDLKAVEDIGLVKFDFLGLRTLTIIDDAVKHINAEREQAGEALMDLTALPLDDEPTFELLRSGYTTAVFQLESRGMQDLIRRLKPDRFEDIIALVALYRPGPLKSGMADDYVKRKHGEAEVDYMHPSLKSIIDTTYGVIVYQEQVIKIAQVLSGYTLGSADILRRAMGKKIPEEMAKQREIFVSGAEANDVDGALATKIFDAVEEFAGYGFNKSHSAAYALLSYQTAYLKTHHPAAFMAAVLSSDIDNTDKIMLMVEECWRMDLALLPPDINASALAFKAVDERSVRYGLAALKGVGTAVVELIINAREAGGPFKDLADLCSRVDLHKVNRRALEAIIGAGAFDQINPNRGQWFAQLGSCIHAATQQADAALAGQDDLFGEVAPVQATVIDVEDDSDHWLPLVQLKKEFQALGFFFSDHPMAVYHEEIQQITRNTLPELIARLDKRAKPTTPQHGRVRGLEVTVAGWVALLRKHQGRAFIRLDDGRCNIEVAVFEELWHEMAKQIKPNRLILVQGDIKYDDFSRGYRLTAKKIWTLEAARELFAERLVIAPKDPFTIERVIELQAILKPFLQGTCPVMVRHCTAQGEANIMLDQAWQVRPTQELMLALREAYGHDAVRLRYKKHALSQAA